MIDPNAMFLRFSAETNIKKKNPALVMELVLTL